MTDDREHPRQAVAIPVSLRDPTNRIEGELRLDTRDLSLGGAFVRSDMLFEVGDELHLALTLPSGRAIEARGQVVRLQRARTAEAGMGIAFTEMSDEDRA